MAKEYRFRSYWVKLVYHDDGVIELCSGNDSAQAASSFYEDPTLAELYYKRMTRYFNDCKKLLKTRSAGAYASCLPDVIDRRLHYFVFGY